MYKPVQLNTAGAIGGAFTGISAALATLSGAAINSAEIASPPRMVRVIGLPLQTPQIFRYFENRKWRAGWRAQTLCFNSISVDCCKCDTADAPPLRAASGV